MKQLTGLVTRFETRILDAANVRRGLVASSLVRIGFGVLLLANYLCNYENRLLLWGPNGEISWHSFKVSLGGFPDFSLYSVARSNLWFEVVFNAGIVITLLFTLGWHPRILTPITWIFTWSLYQRNGFLLDGGNNLLIIVLVYLCFIDTTRISLRGMRAPEPGSMRFQLGSLLHNAGVLAVLLQVCVVYLASGLFKAQGGLWDNGTALYYILRLHEFASPLNRLVYVHGSLIAIGTLGTVLFQVSFPALLLSRSGRHLAFVLAVGLHLSIAVLMGLLSFSLTMIITELFLWEDSAFEAGWARIARLRLRTRRAKTSTIARPRLLTIRKRRPPVIQ